jgi:large subunit ribosomal protein L17
MRHRKKTNHLSRTSSHRKAMLSNMASSLILHKRIHTTTAKAKALRVYIEPLITKSKEDTTHSRRVVFSYLQNKEAVTELFREISVKVAERPGGYTRIIKLPNRLGDNAEMCMMELVDYNENLLTDKAGKAKPTRKRRGGSKKKVEDKAVAEVAVAEETEEVVDEVAAVEELVVTEEAAGIIDEAEAMEEVAVAAAEAKDVAEEKEEEVVAEAVIEEKVEEPIAEVKEEAPKAEAVEEEKKEEEKKEDVPEAKVEEEKPADEEKKDDSKQESK